MKHLHKNRKNTGSIAFDDKEDINPMNYTGNLADAMLVLAVGVMLALIMAYKIDLVDTGASSAKPATEEIEAESFKATIDENSVTIDDLGLEEYGKVYVDQDGNFYVIEE